MKEKIFNLFVFSNLDMISQVGAVYHEIDGTDKEKISFLQSRVQSDFDNVELFDLPLNIITSFKGLTKNSIDYMTYRDLCHKGQNLVIFEKVFEKYHASESPLVVITPVKNGKIKIDGVENINEFSQEFPEKLEIDKQDDWLIGYLDKNGLHLDKLINDDFFEAIRLLYNNSHYVSAMKLLMICIDTMAYLEFGNTKGNFQNWISTYSKIIDLNITANELWEFRNSILHMTNLDSHKVSQGKEKRLLFYVSHPETNYQTQGDEGKYFKFIDLINCIGLAISNWAETYNQERIKFETFVKRYDRILSDKRMTYINYRK